MHCPFCSAVDTKVIDSRLVGDGSQVRRRRQCLECHERFTTFEVAELVMPRVVKSDDSREPFDEENCAAVCRRRWKNAPSALTISKPPSVTSNRSYGLPANGSLC